MHLEAVEVLLEDLLRGLVPRLDLWVLRGVVLGHDVAEGDLPTPAC